MSEIDELLEGAIRDFKEAKTKLTTAQQKIEESARLKESKIADPAELLHSSIGCVIVDSLEPAIRDLGNLSTSGVFPAEVRPATSGDFEAIYRIILETPDLERSDRSVQVPEEIEHAIREPNGVFLVAEDSGTIAGFIYAIQETSTTAIIRYLAVIQPLRHLGIGSRLLSDCMAKLARERDVKEVGAFVRPNTPAVPLFGMHQFRLGESFQWMSRDISGLAETDAPEEE